MGKNSQIISFFLFDSVPYISLRQIKSSNLAKTESLLIFVEQKLFSGTMWIGHRPFKITFDACNGITVINFAIGGRLSRLVEVGWADYRQMELRRRYNFPGCQVPVQFIA